MNLRSRVRPRRDSPSPVARHDKAMRLYLLRSLLSPIVSTRWARFIRRYYRTRSSAGPPPSRVLLKPVRSYVHLRLGPAARFDVLRDHYRLFRQLFSRDVRAARLRRRADRRRRARGAKGERLSPGDRRLDPRFDAARGGAGDLSRQTRRRGAGQQAVARVRPCRRPSRRVSLAGCRGQPAGHKRDVIDATRELHGLRPKDAILLAARAFAKAVGATSVHAVANRHHVLDRLSGASKHADYDAYWRERGATPGGPLGFVFPPLGEVVAARRSAAPRQGGDRRGDAGFRDRPLAGRRRPARSAESRRAEAGPRCFSSLRKRCGSSPRRARC